jgi:hypothetical protein
MAAVADFLAGAFFRAREIGRLDFFMQWWQVVVRQFQCNRIHLVMQMAIVVIRRRSLSLLTKYSGRTVGLPFRIFNRR